MGIGKRIREARLLKNLKQEELARMVGVTTSAIGNYETEVSHPKEPVLYKLMEALNCDANYLFQDEMKKIMSGKTGISLEALDIARKYDSLGEDGKQAINAIMQIELNRANKQYGAEKILNISPEEQQRLHDKTIQRYQDEAAGEEALKQYRIKKLIEKMQNEE